MRTLVLATTVLLAIAAPASAATVEIVKGPCGDRGDCAPDSAAFTARPGERNEVDVTGTVVRDRLAPLETTTCRRIDDHAVDCGTGYANVALGDGDDQLSVDRGQGGIVRVDAGSGADVIAGAFGAVRAGDGDDRITLSGGGFYGPLIRAGAGNDVITATERADDIAPGPGSDVVDAGAGDDLVRDGDPGTDVDRLDGGPGIDELAFRGRRTPVRVDLTAQATGDRDAIAGFESAEGGHADDVLLGDAGPNVLLGAGGNDALDAGDGADLLTGGAGYDRFDGGPGDDRLLTSTIVSYGSADATDTALNADAAPERVACGPGTDVVPELERDLLLPDCERGPRGLRLQPARTTRGGATTFVVSCPVIWRTPWPTHEGPCRGVLTLRIDAWGASRRSRTRYAVGHRGGRVRLRPLPVFTTDLVRLTRRVGRRTGSYEWHIRRAPG